MKTVLYDEHCKLDAKMVSFAGWEMPLQYKGILHEHAAVRESAGLFDVSHMGIIEVMGREAAAFLDFLATNRIADKKPGTATYTVLCAEDGGAIDDTLIYRKSQNDFFLIANAANREADLQHLRKVASQYAVQITERFHDWGILALQGPSSLELMATLFPEVRQLKPMHFIQDPLILSRTGYTGETGFEIYAPNETIAKLWPKLLSLGNVEPCGLGARDLLRLEMGYALYGHELSRTISPLESVAAWTVKFDKLFLGREALEMKKNSRKLRFASAIVLEGQAIAREGFAVQKNGQQIGHVTSGSFSPILEKPIALVLLNQKMPYGEAVEVLIRGKTCPAKVVKLPFVEGKGGTHASN